MAITDKNTLKSWFRTGLKPLASQFSDWMDSYWHKDEKITTGSIEGLNDTLNKKAEKNEISTLSEVVENHFADDQKHKTGEEQSKLNNLADNPNNTYLTELDIQDLNENSAIIIPMDLRLTCTQYEANIIAFVTPLFLDKSIFEKPVYLKYIWKNDYVTEGAEVFTCLIPGEYSKDDKYEYFNFNSPIKVKELDFPDEATNFCTEIRRDSSNTIRVRMDYYVDTECVPLVSSFNFTGTPEGAEIFLSDIQLKYIKTAIDRNLQKKRYVLFINTGSGLVSCKLEHNQGVVDRKNKIVTLKYNYDQELNGKLIHHEVRVISDEFTYTDEDSITNSYTVYEEQIPLSDFNRIDEIEESLEGLRTGLTEHNESDVAHPDIRNAILNMASGGIVVKKSDYTDKLGTSADSYTKTQLDAKINKHIKGVTYKQETATLSFTFENDNVTEIDMPFEHVVKDGRYDALTSELVLMLVSGQEIRIPAAGLMKVYVGKETSTMRTNINIAGEISVHIKEGCVDKTLLSAALIEEIDNHLTLTSDTKTNNTTFTDQSVRANVVSGDSHAILFGKIKKWFSDIRGLAFKDKVDWNEDVINRPNSLPANGGNADTLDNKHASDFALAGTQGLYFTPVVSSDGNVSWINNGGLVNPTSVNVKGAKGDKGSIGLTGAQGPKGDTGATGTQGPKGDSGVAGTQGIAGATGTQGPKGDAGTTGPQGPKGDTGAAGPQGVKGVTGAQGPKGDTGAVGPQGLPGTTATETAATILSKINSQSEIVFSKHVVCSNGAGLVANSDIRFKRNIKPLNSVWNILKEHDYFYYDWENEDGSCINDLIGLSAQQLEKDFPELVYVSDDKRNTHRVDYSKYSILVGKALQEEMDVRIAENRELHKEIDELRSIIRNIKLEQNHE